MTRVIFFAASLFFLVAPQPQAFAGQPYPVEADKVDEDDIKDGVGLGAKEQWSIGPGGPGTANLDWKQVSELARQYGNGKLLVEKFQGKTFASAILTKMADERIYALTFVAFGHAPSLVSRRIFVLALLNWVHSKEGSSSTLYASAPHFYSPWIAEALRSAGFVKVGAAVGVGVDPHGANRDIFVKFADGALDKERTRLRFGELEVPKLGKRLAAFWQQAFAVSDPAFATPPAPKPCEDTLFDPALVHKTKVTNAESK